MIQDGRLLPWPTRDSHASVLPHQHQHCSAGLRYQPPLLSGSPGYYCQDCWLYFKHKEMACVPWNSFWFSPGISVDLPLLTDLASLPLVCLHSACSLTKLPVVTGCNYTMLSLTARSPALTKHCPFAQGFCSWQISLRGEQPFGPYPLPVYPDVQEQNGIGPWEMGQDTESNSVLVTMTISTITVKVFDSLKKRLYIILTSLIFWYLTWSVFSVTTERSLLLFCYVYLRVQGPLREVVGVVKGYLWKGEEQ